MDASQGQHALVTELGCFLLSHLPPQGSCEEHGWEGLVEDMARGILAVSLVALGSLGAN